MIAMGVFYFFAMLPVIALADFTQGKSVLFGYAISIVALMMAGCWAGLGCQIYWKRQLVAAMLVMFTLMGGLISVGILDLQSTFESGTPKIAVSLCVVTVAIFAQLPFIFLNWLGGWRLCFPEQNENQNFTIRDIFAMMFVFAIAFASSQMAKQNLIDQAVAKLEVGAVTYVERPQSSNGTLTKTFIMDSVTVTEENLEQYKRKAVEDNSYEIALIASLYAIIPILILLPIVLFVFRNEGMMASFIRSMLYGILLMALFSIPMISIFKMPVDPMFWLMSFVFFCLIFLAYAQMIVLKKCGLVLKTRWSEGIESKKTETLTADAQ